MEFKHYSVMLQETIENLNIKPDGIYCDGTLGGAGHSSVIAAKLEGGHLFGFDQDKDAIAAATKRLEPFGDAITVVNTNYENMAKEIRQRNISGVDGILLDLGVSSFQLDTEERGFSYRFEDAKLDMRMDQDNPMTAADIVNEYSMSDLVRILRDYGEERFAKNIAANILKARETAPIETVGQLNEIIKYSIPKKAQVNGGHPSKRTYQAIRIELNRELSVLENSINEMIDLLNPGGRFCIITFHSLEDRIVKNAFKTAENPCICPPDFPVCTCNRVSAGHVVSRKPILPSPKELEENSRSKSAKLRVFEKA